MLRVKPTAAHGLPGVRLRVAVPRARRARHAHRRAGADRCAWFEADDVEPRCAVLRDGARSTGARRRQPAVHASAGWLLEESTPEAAAHARRERDRRAGRGPRGRLARARPRLPRQAAVRTPRVRAAAPLLRGVVRVGRPTVEPRRDRRRRARLDPRAHAHRGPRDHPVLGRRPHQQPALRRRLPGRRGRSTGRWSRSPTR